MPNDVQPTKYDWDSDNYYKKLHWRLHILASFLNQQECNKILDIGCGKGRIKDLLKPEIDYYGCDAFLTESKSRNIVKWKYEKKGNLPFQGTFFDTIICSGFIEYIDSRQEFFKLVSDKLEKSGLFLFSAINPKNLRILLHKLKIPYFGYVHPAWKELEEYELYLKYAQNVNFEIEGVIPIKWQLFHFTNANQYLENSLVLSPHNIPTNWGPFVPQVIYICRKKFN